MYIDEITIIAERTVGHPTQQYENFKPKVIMKVKVESNDDPVAVARDVQVKCEKLNDLAEIDYVIKSKGGNPYPSEEVQPKPGGLPATDGKIDNDAPNEATMFPGEEDNKPATRRDKLPSNPLTAGQLKAINNCIKYKNLDKTEKAWIEQHIRMPYNVTEIKFLAVKEASELIKKLLPDDKKK